MGTTGNITLGGWQKNCISVHQPEADFLFGAPGVRFEFFGHCQLNSLKITEQIRQTQPERHFAHVHPQR